MIEISDKITEQSIKSDINTIISESYIRGELGNKDSFITLGSCNNEKSKGYIYLPDAEKIIDEEIRKRKLDGKKFFSYLCYDPDLPIMFNNIALLIMYRKRGFDIEVSTEDREYFARRISTIRWA